MTDDRPHLDVDIDEPSSDQEFQLAPLLTGKLSLREWLRKNLFKNRYNSVITILLGGVAVYLGYRFFNFVFFTARWAPVEENLTLFMIGRFPRDEQWRVVAQVLLWSATMGLAWGAAVAGAKVRAVRSGIPYVEDSTLSRVRRYGGLLVLLALLLLLTRSFGPLLVVAAAFVVAGALQWLAAHKVAESYVGLLWAGVAVLGVLGFQIVSGGQGNAWLWTGAPVAAAAWSLVGRRDFTDLKKLRTAQSVAAVLVLVVAFVVYTIIDFEGIGWDKWEGFHLNLLATAVAIVLAFPLGLLLALARRSSFPALRIMSTAYIEAIRGVPLISLLLMAQFFIGFFLNTSTPLSLITRALAAMTLFTAAYVAEIVRGGLQSVPRGQIEAGQSVGLSPFRVTRLIVLPQALRAVIPAMVGQFISLFKDTSLLTIIGVSEILNVRELVHSQADFRGFGIAETLVFVMFAFWAISFTMSRESQRLERRLGVGER